MRTHPLVILLFFCAGLQAQSEMAEDEVPVSKRAVSIELLGRGLLGGVYYEHTLWDNVFHTKAAVGSGIGILPNIGARPLIYPPLPEPSPIVPIIPFYVNIIPQVSWLQPQSQSVRFYFESGIWLPQLFSRGYLAAGVRVKRNPTGIWGRMGVIFLLFGGEITTKAIAFPSFTLGWAF